ncbi:uncharacterized protein LOC110847077 [Folsomia candida]|uniref:uncharacterized protein LOC110847077 n=1 Tax=Folsomia candida TaxID=158441 RepID=UPI000B8F2BE9|nr:uncharacterized protein LOC110847077 [Folsomia candida]
MYNYRNNRQRRKSLSQNWGSSFLRTKISREQYLLEKRTLKDIQYWEWLFIVISLFSVLINLGVNIYQLTMALINQERYLFPVLCMVFNLFAIYFTFVGALKELPFQILMQLVTKIIIWIFNLIYFLTPKDKEYQEDETENEVKAIRFYVSSSLLFLTVCVGGFVFYQYWTSNLSLFKTVGTEPKYVNMCRKLHLGQSLIILDVEITFVAVLLAASSGLSTNDLFALIVLPVGVLLVVIWACIGFFAMKKESRMLTYTFYILSHLQPVYVIYLLVRSPKSSVGGLLFNSIIVVAGLFFIIHVILLVTVVKIQFNYDKGLKQAAEKEIARTKSLAQSLNVSTEFIDRPSVPRHTEI